jgi:hypothetical protein
VYSCLYTEQKETIDRSSLKTEGRQCLPSSGKSPKQQTKLHHQSGGAIEVEDLSTAVRGQVWRVEMPDGRTALFAEPSGSVELVKSGRENENARSSLLSRESLNFAFVFIVVLLGVSLFSLIVNDMRFGSLTFTIFIKELGLFLGGLGIGKYANRG